MRRGSALIIAILLIAVVGGVAFGIGRMLFLEIGSVSAYDDGVHAYYAAESGIEEGFLRYRFGQNAEVPFNIPVWTDPVDANKVLRSDLTSYSIQSSVKIESGIDKSSNNGIDAGHQVYDLRMGSEVAGFGNRNNVRTLVDSTSPYYISRDEAKKFTVDFSGNRDIDLYFYPKNNVFGPSPLNQSGCLVIEIKVNSKTGTFNEEKKALFKNSSCNYGSLLNGITFPYVADTGNDYYSIVKLKSFIWPILNSAETELYIKPIGDDIAIAFLDNVTGQNVYGPFASIESTGYYNGVSRKLSANIDRQSGTLYDLFDYVVYKEN